MSKMQKIQIDFLLLATVIWVAVTGQAYWPLAVIAVVWFGNRKN